jgi:hypothetical protein
MAGVEHARRVSDLPQDTRKVAPREMRAARQGTRPRNPPYRRRKPPSRNLRSLRPEGCRGSQGCVGPAHPQTWTSPKEGECRWPARKRCKARRKRAGRRRICHADPRPRAARGEQGPAAPRLRHRPDISVRAKDGAACSLSEQWARQARARQSRVDVRCKTAVAPADSYASLRRLRDS